MNKWTITLNCGCYAVGSLENIVWTSQLCPAHPDFNAAWDEIRQAMTVMQQAHLQDLENTLLYDGEVKFELDGVKIYRVKRG